MRIKGKAKKALISVLIIPILGLSTYYMDDIQKFILNIIPNEQIRSYEINNLPEYSGNDFVYINNNEPEFTKEELSKDVYEEYSDFDILGRCGVASAIISLDTMPKEERGFIGQIKPTGWHTIKYDFIDGKYLYNRCHLIGYQLTGENANEKNLITCTRHMNSSSMLKFENEVAEYVKKTSNRVMYRVTPIFKDKNLLATGVQIEALSIEDNGKGIKFNVFVYNVQDKIQIDYSNGDSKVID
ncbi:MAG: DNA/RNA non-specific endonuclease [Bacilli bacterium]|nr:DNA/RNA non-specific endonuclease [Bacilli bacterium]